MNGAIEFLHQVQNDPGFIERAQAFTSDGKRRAFLRDEGFQFVLEELDAAMVSLAFLSQLKRVQEAKELRKGKRYEVFLKVIELNGQPMNDTVILDISAWGAPIEFMISLPSPDSPVEIRFSLPGEDKKTHVRLTGKVV